jgi:hypothetical protein
MNRYRVVYAATYVGEIVVEAESVEEAQVSALEEIDPKHETLTYTGERLEFTDGQVTRVDPERDQ